MINLSYAVLILTLVLLTIIGWGITIYINKKNGRSYFTPGNILMCISYLPLVYRNLYLYHLNKQIPEILLKLTLMTSITQLAAVVYFILAHFYIRYLAKIENGNSQS